MPNTRRGRAPDRNIAQEFENYFGNETNLANWQNLCEDVGIKDDLNSIRKCKLVRRPLSLNNSKGDEYLGTLLIILPCLQALNGVWVNIHDLLDAVNNNSKPRIFKTERALAAYTMSTGKIYPKKEAKKGGPVRALLAHIFH
jgi:hypothetical protein